MSGVPPRLVEVPSPSPESFRHLAGAADAIERADAGAYRAEMDAALEAAPASRPAGRWIGAFRIGSAWEALGWICSAGLVLLFLWVTLWGKEDAPMPAGPLVIPAQAASRPTPAAQRAVVDTGAEDAPVPGLAPVVPAPPEPWVDDREIEGEGDASRIDWRRVRRLAEGLRRARQAAGGAGPPSDLWPCHDLLRDLATWPYERTIDPLDAAQVGARRRGDSLDRSVWLADRLARLGYRRVEIVLGVAPGYRPPAPGHAWVEVVHRGERYAMETTLTEAKIFAPDAAPTREHSVVARVAAPSPSPAGQ